MSSTFTWSRPPIVLASWFRSVGSEVQWCDADRKDYARFDAALDHTFQMLDVMGYTYAKHVRGIIGLPGQEQPARSPEELKEYLEANKGNW